MKGAEFSIKIRVLIIVVILTIISVMFILVYKNVKIRPCFDNKIFGNKITTNIIHQSPVIYRFKDLLEQNGNNTKEVLYDQEITKEIELIYNKKIWVYEIPTKYPKSKNYEIDNIINKYNRCGKNNKINLIKKMQKININNEIIIEYIFPKLINKINKIKNNIEIKDKNAEINGFLGKKLIINKEIIGVKLDYYLLLETIINEYCENEIVRIQIPIIKIEPTIKYSDLLECSNLRSSFSTSFPVSSYGRKENIKCASKKINGYMLAPNQKFSFNKVVGQTSVENGFRTAKVILNGEFVDGIGGGVCQVSTTLYNAVLSAGLSVEKANKHSERVWYVKAGFDAMINYNTSDLVFKNTTNKNIYIFSKVGSEKVTFYIFGAEMNGYDYKLRSEIIDTVKAGCDQIICDTEAKYADKVLYTDESFYLKKRRDGYKIKSYRDVYSNNQLVRTELIRTDNYPVRQGVKVIGSKVREIEDST